MSAIDQIIRNKEQYIQAIDEMLKECNDIPLLDLIYKLLSKSI